METGKATGPQRVPRVRRAREPAVEPAPAAAEQAALTSAEKRCQRYEALLARIRDQVEQCGERLDNMPRHGVELEAEPSDDLLGGLMDLEKRVTNLRVDLDQIGCGL